MKFLLLLSLVAVAVTADTCSRPPVGSSVVTKTVTTTTVTTVADSSSSSSSEDGSLLSGSDRRLIRSTWELVEKKGSAPPKVLFRFLEEHPEYQKMFKSFADVPQSELMKNGKFLAQAYTIAAGLNVVIHSIDSNQLLAQEMNHLGVTHFPRNVKPNMFEQFGKVWISVIQEELGSRFTAEAKEAFENGFRMLISGISKSLMKKENVADPITGLTSHQIWSVRTAWEKIRSERSAFVTTVFKKMFASKPDLQSSFVKFADVAVSDLDSNEDFQTQMNLVADRLDNMISTLDNTLTIMGQFQYMGHSHAPRHIGRPEFEQFGRYFLELLSTKGVSRDALESFRDVYRICVNKIMEYHY